MIEFVDQPPVLFQAPGYGVISSGPTRKVTVAGAEARRFVDLVKDGRPIEQVARARSDVAGDYKFSGLPIDQEYIVIARERRHARVYQDTIRAGIYPIEP